MKRVVLISCVSKKRSTKSRAKDLYMSPLFRPNLQYAQKFEPDAIFVWSAKYGLVELDTEIEPYDVTLNTMRANDRKEWTSKVVQQLQLHTNLREDYFTILAGVRYRQYLLPHLRFYVIPLTG